MPSYIANASEDHQRDGRWRPPRPLLEHPRCTTWGDKNKLAIHIPSGIHVDFFATTERAWHNYLVCRTGGAENNIAISTAAQKKAGNGTPTVGASPTTKAAPSKSPPNAPPSN